MKNIKSYLFVLLASFAMTSCLVDDDLITDGYVDSPNMVGFTSANATASFAADEESHNFIVAMSVTGPKMRAIDEAVVATISVDPSSTAIAGTHFELNQTTVTLSPENNMINDLNITILTAGLEPPITPSPYIILNVNSVTGGNGAIVNGRTGQVKVTINYLCFSDLAGSYSVNTHYVYAGGGIDTFINSTDNINALGSGTYRTENVGHWTQAALGGTPGFNFSDVCDAITIPQQNLVDLYSNLVEGVAGASFVDPDTGVIYMEYTICASGACRQYYVTYTPN